MLPWGAGLNTSAVRQLGITSTRSRFGEFAGIGCTREASKQSTRAPPVKSHLGARFTVSTPYAPTLIAVTLRSVVVEAKIVPAKACVVSGSSKPVFGTVLMS